MYDMSVTFAVLKLEISKLVRLVQPPNMLDIVVMVMNGLKNLMEEL